MGRKRFLQGFGAAYLGWAVLAGFAMKATIPALNLLGVAYVGLTSPIAMTCIATGADCSNVPPQRWSQYLFSFDGEDAA